MLNIPHDTKQYTKKKSEKKKTTKTAISSKIMEIRNNVDARIVLQRQRNEKKKNEIQMRLQVQQTSEKMIMKTLFDFIILHFFLSIHIHCFKSQYLFASYHFGNIFFDFLSVEYSRPHGHRL